MRKTKNTNRTAKPTTWCSLFERSEFLIATPKKKKLCVCSTNLGFSMHQIRMIPGTYYVPDTYVPHFMIPGTYYVPDTYDTRYVLCTRYVCTTRARTFRPWTHTSDDSYIYQLSLVVATATCIFINRFFLTKAFFSSFFLVFEFSLVPKKFNKHQQKQKCGP